MENGLRSFFNIIFGASNKIGGPRFICFARIMLTGQVDHRYFAYPENLDGGIEWAREQSDLGHNVYYCPNLFSSIRRKKESVPFSTVVWADLDECGPENLRIEPTLVVETSPNRYQAIWCLNEAVPPEDAEDLSKRVAYHHRDQGADVGCWDMVHLMRVPFTKNLKYANTMDEAPIVSIIKAGNDSYDPEYFNEYYEPVAKGPGRTSFELDYAKVEAAGDADDILAKYHNRSNPDLGRLFYQIAPPKGSGGKSASEDLWNLEMMCFECGMTREETFVVARDSSCNKYVRDGRPESHLWADVCKAFTTFEEKMGYLFHAEEVEVIQLLSEEEIASVQDRHTFIEQYVDWASKRTDSPVAFHVGGALMTLSAVLSEHIRIPVSYNATPGIQTNLWVLLLADTTVTRKSTAMGYPLQLLEEILPDVLLATDGSIEGLLGGLANRPNKASMYERDEFSGFMSAVAKKDYMGDMIPNFCKLYDGSHVKRLLRKEEIMVKNPNFLIFAAGARSKVFEQLTSEHVLNGFLPRFITIFGSTEISALRPIGPPTTQNHAERQALVAKLSEVSDYYSQRSGAVLRLTDTGTTINNKKEFWKAELTPEAWERVGNLQRYLLNVADSHDSKEYLLPCVERLTTNVLKCAALISASERREGNKVTIHLEDILHTLYYARSWMDNLMLAMNLIGNDPFEGQLQRVNKEINDRPGVTRSHLMQKFRLTSRTANDVFHTLEERGLVVGTHAGKGTRFFPPERIQIDGTMVPKDLSVKKLRVKTTG